VRYETRPSNVGLKSEFKEEAFKGTDVDYDDWPSLDRVVAIDTGGDGGDIWLIEPCLVVKARQFAVNAIRQKQAKDQGLPVPVAPLHCPTPRYTENGTTGYLFLSSIHENSNLPPEIIDLIVQYSLRDKYGDGYDRATAFSLCSTSRRMHKVCQSHHASMFVGLTYLVKLAVSALWQSLGGSPVC
jgi:hypothetical protein